MVHFGPFLLIKPGYTNQRLVKETSKHGISIKTIYEILRGFSGFFFERRAERVRRMLERFQSD
jgi:hypothetical protein